MSKIKLSKEFIRNTVKLALNEDLYPSGDITSGLIKNDKIVTVKLLSNQNAIIGGLLFAKQAFALIDSKIKFIIKKKDGSKIKKGSLVALIKGNAKNILIAERVALNFLSHISGIATKTNAFVKLAGKKTKICCTRKTIPNELKNILYAENEIFNTPFSLEVINHKDETKLYTKLDLDFAKLQIENILNYKDDIKSGAATILFNTDKSLINYKTNKNFFEFNYSNELESKKFLYNGKFNFKPFYSSLEGDAEEINVSYLFGTNAIVAELLKTEIFNNKNLDFKLNIYASKIKNNRNFTNLFLKSKIQEGLIDIDNTKLEWKDNSLIKLTDTLIFVRDGTLFLEGKSKIKITNAKNIYKFLLTPKNFRKNIKTIDFNFSYSFNEKAIILNGIMIDGKYNQKVNSNLNNIYFRGSSRQNKIFLKNMINDLLKFYSG